MVFLRDQSGTTSFVGDVFVEGAAPGDVFTVQPDGSLAPAPLPPDAPQDLAQVLAVGADAGGLSIANPAPLYGPPTVAEVLAAGNDAGGGTIQGLGQLVGAVLSVILAGSPLFQTDSNTIELLFTTESRTIRFRSVAQGAGQLGPGSLALWLDSTNGAPAVRFRGVQDNGVEVAGSLPLAP